eukprot:scaffold4372_cov397-Prasinococcus_capsulatus_cf.AAC.45
MHWLLLQPLRHEPAVAGLSRSVIPYVVVLSSCATSHAPDSNPRLALGLLTAASRVVCGSRVPSAIALLPEEAGAPMQPLPWASRARPGRERGWATGSRHTPRDARSARRRALRHSAGGSGRRAGSGAQGEAPSPLCQDTHGLGRSLSKGRRGAARGRALLGLFSGRHGCGGATRSGCDGKARCRPRWRWRRICTWSGPRRPSDKSGRGSTQALSSLSAGPARARSSAAAPGPCNSPARARRDPPIRWGESANGRARTAA